VRAGICWHPWEYKWSSDRWRAHTGTNRSSSRPIRSRFLRRQLHKWMMAPKGSGFLHVRREMQSIIEPVIVSWGYKSEKPGPSRLIDYVEWQGTSDISAFLSVPATIKFMRAHTWDKVQSSCHDLLQGFRQAMTDVTDLPPITPDSTDWYAQMAAFPLPTCDDEGLQRALYEQFHVEVPITSWNGHSFIRVSVQAYNDRDDLETLTAGLRNLLPMYRNPC